MNSKKILACAIFLIAVLAVFSCNRASKSTVASDKIYNILVTEDYPTIDGEEALSALIKDRGAAIFESVEEEIRLNDEAAMQAGGTGFTVDTELSFDVSYKPGRHDAQVCSIVTDTQWFSGGAHGAELVESYLWDVKAKKLLSLNDVLPLAGFASLGELSTRVQSELEKTINPAKDAQLSAMIKDGTQPVADNFKVFLLEDARITFYFQRYQVAPGASGVQTVSFPVKQAR